MSRRSILNTRGESFSRGIAPISLAFKRHRQDAFLTYPTESEPSLASEFAPRPVGGPAGDRQCGRPWPCVRQCRRRRACTPEHGGAICARRCTRFRGRLSVPRRLTRSPRDHPAARYPPRHTGHRDPPVSCVLSSDRRGFTARAGCLPTPPHRSIKARRAQGDPGGTYRFDTSALNGNRTPAPTV